MVTSLPDYEGRKLVSPFEPQVETIEARESRSRDLEVTAPEKNITLFAFRLSILEKAASGLGTLASVWATVVLLGGFAVTLKAIDFWFVSLILLTEGVRIFSRSHELEWQHETTLISVAELRDNAKQLSRWLYISGRCMCKKTQNPKLNTPAENYGVDNHGLLKRTWSTSEVQLVPYTGWLSMSRNASSTLRWLQLVSALTCVALSLFRLATQDFGVVSGTDTRNQKSALNKLVISSLSRLLNSDPANRPPVKIRQDSTAVVLYSSGTTGRSKGVVCTHRNLIAMTSILCNLLGSSRDVYLCFILLFHMYGFNTFVCGLMALGATVVILPHFTMEGMLMAIHRYRVTHLPAVPAIAILLSKIPDVEQKYDLSSLKEVIIGGASMGREQMEAFRSRFPAIGISQGT